MSCSEPEWYLYILDTYAESKRSFGQQFFYTGISRDVGHRYWEHRHGVRSSLRRHHKVPRRILFVKPLHTTDKDVAEREEQRMKNVKKPKKWGLIKAFQAEHPLAASHWDQISRVVNCGGKL